MPPEETPAPEPAPQTPPAEPPQTTPEASSAPAEATQTPETAQIPPSEPIVIELKPIAPAPEPPSSAAPVQTGILHTARDLLNKARVAIQDRKRKKRDKIMQALNAKNKITNDEVEKLLHVSDATATRYLSALEKENKIRQIGKTGTGVVYQKV